MKSTQAILFLLVVNLIATIWFGVESTNQPNMSAASIENSHQLPSNITSEDLDKLFNQFRSTFNMKDHDALYALLGPATRARINKEDSDATLEKLVDVFHSIEKGGFEFSEFISSQGSVSKYALNYAVKFSSESQFGEKGILVISIAAQGNTFEIYRYELKATRT